MSCATCALFSTTELTGASAVLMTSVAFGVVAVTGAGGKPVVTPSAVTVTVYWPAASGLVTGMVYVGPVAPVIGCPLKFHW